MSEKGVKSVNKGTEKFIEEAKAVHGENTYDYSNTIYVNAKTKVKIRCLKCGKEFEQIPGSHLKGHGCRSCAESIKHQKYNGDSFIAKAKEIHKDENLDYSLVDYKTWSTPVRIICHEKDKWGFEHGEFEQLPSNHCHSTHPQGCPKCSGNYTYTKEEAILRANITHNNKYDYSLVEEFKSLKDEITIICPEHGPFRQRIDQHLMGKGCNKCSGKGKTTEDIINDFRKAHGDIDFDYSEVVYKGGDEEVCIKCPIHGKFWIKPAQFITNKFGCPNCGKLSKEYKLSLLTENDVKKNLSDSRFFCLSGLEILALIKAGVLPKDFISIAHTQRGSRARLEAMQALRENLTNETENSEQTENTDSNNVDVESVETLEEIERIDNEDDVDLIVDELTGLPVINTHSNILRNGDVPGIDKLDPTSDNGKFIVENTINKWWCAINDDADFINEIKEYHGSKFYDYIKEEFFKEYNGVLIMKNPNGYSLPFDLYPYQKLFAYRLSSRESYSNWCDMGAGKTFSCLYASRYNRLKKNIVIAPKSVLQESWISSIYESFPDSKVIAFFGDNADEFKTTDNKKYNKWINEHLTIVNSIDDFKSFENGYNYLLINYDKFSQSYAKELVDTIVKNYKLDYVILDEIQKVKYRESSGGVSERNKFVTFLLSEIRKSSPKVKVSALTGTPLINELSEVSSIVELATGKPTGIKSNRVNIENVSEANKAIVINGFRYRPEINVKHILLTPEIECSKELEKKIKRLASQRSYYGELESDLALEKINSPEVIQEIKPGTIIYVLYPYKNNTASQIIQKVESLGYRVGAYLGSTPNKHEVFEDFVKGNYDVLVASSPISVGVNGLQNISDRMIIISLPQTNADYEQLIKRIVRKRKDGSILKDKDVKIIVPQIVLKLNGVDGDETEWSWDRSRMNALLYKKNLGDAVMDGDIQKVFRIDWNKLYRNAMQRFKDGIKDEVEEVKAKIEVEEPEERQVVRERATSVINEVHRRANSSNHSTIYKRFFDNPKEFQEYHKAREISKADWVEDPVDYVASIINDHYSNKKIADLGCGTNKLSSLMKNGNSVRGFDCQQWEGHSEVIKADIADLSGVVEDSEMDIAVFCLSLWGQDYEDYFKEANRILKNNGRVIVVEPNDKFGEGKRYGDESDFINLVEKYGFFRMGKVVKRNNFTYFRFIKED